MRLHIEPHADRETLEAMVMTDTEGGAKVNTDEWRSYDHLPEMGV